MSDIIKKTSGLTAHDWIDRYTILEAKILLRSTNKTIQEISNELNFPNHSFFSKYFKHHMGMTPKAYRLSSMQNKIFHYQNNEHILKGVIQPMLKLLLIQSHF